MRAIFNSKFPQKEEIKKIADKNSLLLNKGVFVYRNFLNIMEKLQDISDDQYISIQDIYDNLKISPFIAESKRNIYNRYNSGIIVGAGSGEDCIELINNKSWFLFDLSDERMINKAIGYKDGKVIINKTKTSDGDTITSVAKKYRMSICEKEIIKIDSINLGKIEMISLDAEGSALDILAGATETIINKKPDLLISIYHNWVEYLLIIPFVYDLGYEIEAMVTTNMIPQQPHLDLSLYCRPKKAIL